MSAQVSWWVPLGAAVIGIVGVVLGQWYSSRRDDRRWEREYERERERADRELARERLRLDHEIVRHWSERRMDAYAATLEAIRECEQSAASAYAGVKFFNTGHTELTTPAWLDSARNLHEQMARVRLVGSRAVLAKLGVVIGIADRQWRDFRYDDQAATNYVQWAERLARAEADLAVAIRDDLGVTSPPSAPAS